MVPCVRIASGGIDSILQQKGETNIRAIYGGLEHLPEPTRQRRGDERGEAKAWQTGKSEQNTGQQQGQHCFSYRKSGELFSRTGLLVQRFASIHGQGATRPKPAAAARNGSAAGLAYNGTAAGAC